MLALAPVAGIELEGQFWRRSVMMRGDKDRSNSDVSAEFGKPDMSVTPQFEIFSNNAVKLVCWDNTAKIGANTRVLNQSLHKPTVINGQGIKCRPFRRQLGCWHGAISFRSTQPSCL